MPALVLFNRRWSIGSDDLIVPASFLFLVHVVWINLLIFVLTIIEFDTKNRTERIIWIYLIVYTIIAVTMALIELAICIVSFRGSILDKEARKSINILVYLKSCIILIEIAVLMFGSCGFLANYEQYIVEKLRRPFAALVVCNWILIAVQFLVFWCSYDSAGKSWFKMNRFQKSFASTAARTNSRHPQHFRRSGSLSRNWRRRKMIRDYEQSWNSRCRFLLCCISLTDRNKSSFSNIARLWTDFFRDLDIVPTDVLTGLVLLRKFQKIEARKLLEQKEYNISEFLSGVPIKSTTEFLDLYKSNSDYSLFQDIIYYMSYALGAYGWPIYVKSQPYNVLCQFFTKLNNRLCCNCCLRENNEQESSVHVVEDNCCHCNYVSLRETLKGRQIDFVYVTYHVDVGKTPFYLAVDYDKKAVVLSVRGTLSFQDVLTDLNAESDLIPVEPRHESWTGHKGMIEAAQYIYNLLCKENLLEKAFERNNARGTRTYRLVLVGHSLGAGTASILAILLRQHYPNLICYSYAPPGGLLSLPAVEYTKEFITSVVIGKDVVPRLGLRQMETLRADLINALKMSIDPKWKTLICSAVCCGCASQPTSVQNLNDEDIQKYQQLKESTRTTGSNLFATSATLQMHFTPLYPPGNIIHVVRRHTTATTSNRFTFGRLSSTRISYQAIRVQNTDFGEILISPVMVHDHMPDTMLRILQQTLPTTSPQTATKKPSVETRSVCIETSFASATPTPTSVTVRKRKYDLIYDDWLGLAPLASPETLSDASVSLRTPKIMRRAPKISENLSKCAYDVSLADKFRQMLTSRDRFVIDVTGSPIKKCTNFMNSISNAVDSDSRCSSGDSLSTKTTVSSLCSATFDEQTHQQHQQQQQQSGFAARLPKAANTFVFGSRRLYSVHPTKIVSPHANRRDLNCSAYRTSDGSSSLDSYDIMS